MIYEDDVVDCVVGFIEEHGWTIESLAHANEHGDDIAATRGGRRLLVEAKGEGSSKAGTRRFGLGFTRGQVGSHLGVAVVRALRWASKGDVLPALAFPDNQFHRSAVEPITPALERVGVGVFWVKEDRTVELQAPWDLGT